MTDEVHSSPMTPSSILHDVTLTFAASDELGLCLALTRGASTNKSILLPGFNPLPSTGAAATREQ